MKKACKKKYNGNTRPADITALVKQLSAAEKALLNATTDQVDAIIQANEQPYLLYTLRDALHKSQNELLASEKRFRSLIENSNDIISLIDENGIITYSSPSITVILGYKDDERVGHSIFENIHPDDLPRLKKSFKQLLNNPNKVINEITRYRHKKGKWRWMEGYAKNLLDDPSVQSIVLNYRDITDYRIAEEKLSENKRRLSILIDNLPGVVYRCLNDHDWTMEYLSSGITDLSGFKPEDFGSKWSGYNDIIHPDDRNKVWECVQAAIEKRKSFQLEYRIKTKTGETKWVWEQGAGIIDEEGNVCALEGFITDITEHKLSRENERMLASVIRQTDDAVVITDSEGTIEYVNPAFEKMTGYSSHETLGKKPDLIKSGKHDDAFYKNLWKTILKGEQFNAVFSNIRKNGELFYEQETITPLMDDEGGITHFVSTGKDITSLIRAEEELRESERFSRATLDGLSAHIVIIDETGTILHVNKAWRKFAEENATETNCVCEGANYISACNIDSEGAGKKFASGIKSVLEGKRDEFQLEYTCHSSSEKRWFEGRVTLFPGDGVKKAIIAHENITERKLSEEALRGEIDFSSAVLNSLPGILYCFNDDLKVLRWNKNFEKVSGYTSEEVSRLNPLDLFEGKDRELVADRIHEVFEKGASDVEVELTTKKGERIPYYFTGVSTEIEGMPCQLGVGLDLTERKIAEEKIRKSNLLLENAQRIAHMGSWDMDVKNNYLTWSEETYCIFGITPDDFDNSFEMFYSLIHPDDREKMDRAQEIAMTDQSPLEVEYRIIRPDGQVRTLYERGEIIYNSGEMIRKTGVVLDITERKRNEDALIASEAQLSNALQIARAGHWEYDVGSDEFKFNDHFYSIFHTTVDKAGGYTMSSAEFAEKYVHPEDMDVVKTEIHQAIETTDPGYTSELEHRVIFPDGKIGYVAVRIFIIKNEKGRTIKTYGINQDITERKRSEEALSISKANLTRAQRIAKLGSWELDFGTGDLFWSDEVYNIFGISPDDFAGTYQYFFSMVHPEDKGRLQEAQDQALAGENKLDIEHRIECPDGTLRWVHELGELILDKHGKPVQLAGTVMDITDRKIAEEELQANEAQLRQLQRMESIGQLTGGVAHDFNNLLTVILGNAEILNEKLASEPQLQSMAGMMVSAARRGAELTQRLLAFARKQTLEPRETNINLLISDMEAMLQRSLGEHIEIDFNLDDGLWTAMVDPGQLENAVLNLCINARDAMPSGGNLSLETSNIHLDPDYVVQHIDVETGDYVMLAISDNGTGIDPKHLDKVFEPFFTTKEVSKGTGLGLSMVYGFIKQSGGHVNIYSEPGQGTVVKLFLPRVFDKKSQISPVTDKKGTATGGSETILLVEDDDMVRQHVHGQLQSMGYRVRAAEDGPQALSILREQDDIDLLFTDVVMPGGMSGRDLANEACRLQPGLKVLYTTGYTRDSIVYQGRLESGVQLLSKPYERNELARKLRQMLD